MIFPGLSVAELRAKLTAADIPVPAQGDDAQLEFVLSCACLSFQDDTGFTPFFVAPDSEPKTYRFQSRAGLVTLTAGLLRLDSIQIGDGGTTFDTQDEETGYLELGRPKPNWPATWFRFADAFNSAPGQVRVSGLWGFCSVIPDTVKEAIYCRAATLHTSGRGLVSTFASDAPTAATVKRRDDDGVSEEFFDPAPAFKSVLDARQRERDTLVRNWRTVYDETTKSHRFR